MLGFCRGSAHVCPGLERRAWSRLWGGADRRATHTSCCCLRLWCGCQRQARWGSEPSRVYGKKGRCVLVQPLIKCVGLDVVSYRASVCRFVAADKWLGTTAAAASVGALSASSVTALAACLCWPAAAAHIRRAACEHVLHGYKLCGLIPVPWCTRPHRGSPRSRLRTGAL